MKTLILGGVRSGKSRLAQSLAGRSHKQVVYVATATNNDIEMQMRIELHQSNRPAEWLVIEEPLQLANVVSAYNSPKYCILIDCVTLWLTNLLLTDDKQLLTQERNALCDRLKKINTDIILVSNETGLGIMPLGELTRRFGDEAGVTNQLLAALCEQVVFTIAGLPLTLKGKPHAG